MSASLQSKRDFAKMVLNHPAFEDIREDVEFKIFQRFRSATVAEREILNCILDNGSLFFKELKALVAQEQDIQETEE
jgi:hypothetical protein